VRAVELVLYMRPGCHLCADAVRDLEVAARQLAIPLHLRSVDIDRDPELLRRYMIEIPVLARPDGRPLLRAPFGLAQLRALLSALGSESSQEVSP
jgi:hypothetical protein